MNARWHGPPGPPCLGDRRHMESLKVCPKCSKAGFHAPNCGIEEVAAP